ncbi:hypothetical protein ERO13_A10G195050v2 [Gossypium hirsutum]|nr:hypothetical protein ERO13_A10G195050v2 [Gossypium hirsutum]
MGCLNIIGLVFFIGPGQIWASTMGEPYLLIIMMQSKQQSIEEGTSRVNIEGRT